MAAAPAPSHDNRFDVLRLLAAWLVLLNHCYPLAGRGEADPLTRLIRLDTSGGLGVAIFFALSGYLVTVSLERSTGALDFVRRRALRIYPALVAICLLCVLLLGPLVTSLPLKTYLHHPGTWNYLRTASGFELVYALPGVFEHNPLPHVVNGSLWSLPYELRCYLALLVISLLPLRMRLKTLLAAGALAAVLLARPSVSGETAFQPFLGLDYHATKLGLIFAIGAAFASWRAALGRRGWHLAGVAGLAALAVAYGWPALLASRALYCAGIATVALWAALHARWLPRIPERMGDWSYGAYLYGFPVQQLLALAGLHLWGMPAYLLACTALTFALAGLSWHGVEKRALKFKYAAAPADRAAGAAQQAGAAR